MKKYLKFFTDDLTVPAWMLYLQIIVPLIFMFFLCSQTYNYGWETGVKDVFRNKASVVVDENGNMQVKTGEKFLERAN